MAAAEPSPSVGGGFSPPEPLLPAREGCFLGLGLEGLMQSLDWKDSVNAAYDRKRHDQRRKAERKAAKRQAALSGAKPPPKDWHIALAKAEAGLGWSAAQATAPLDEQFDTDVRAEEFSPSPLLRRDWQGMPRGCDPSAGQLSMVRTWRKRRQVENLVGPVQWLVRLRADCILAGAAIAGVSSCPGSSSITGGGRAEGNGTIRVVDFCASSGYVGLPVAAVLLNDPDFATTFTNHAAAANAAAHAADNAATATTATASLPPPPPLRLSVEVTDVRNQSIGMALDRLNQCGDVAALRGCVEARVEKAQDHHGVFDVGVALHACGPATDLVLDQCLKARAAFVLAPCCVGNLAQPAYFSSRPRSKRVGSVLSVEEMRAVSRSGDCTVRCVKALTEDDQMRRRCKRVVDEDRLSLAREAGYIVRRFRMTPFACSPKNDVLVGWPEEWKR